MLKGSEKFSPVSQLDRGVSAELIDVGSNPTGATVIGNGHSLGLHSCGGNVRGDNLVDSFHPHEEPCLEGNVT